MKTFIKEMFGYIKNEPKQAGKEFAAVVMIFILWFAALWLSAILQGCSVQKNTNIRGRATIITVDTTYINHTGKFKYPKK